MTWIFCNQIKLLPGETPPVLRIGNSFGLLFRVGKLPTGRGKADHIRNEPLKRPFVYEIALERQRERCASPRPTPPLGRIERPLALKRLASVGTQFFDSFRARDKANRGHDTR